MVSGNILNNGTGSIHRSDDLIYSGLIPGAGNLVKTGSNALTLAGPNTYTGSTTIQNGLLRINGFFGSSTVNVGCGAALGGSGITAGPVNVISGGLLDPGNGPGMLTGGHLTLQSGSETKCRINGLPPGTSHDQVQVVLTSALDGTAQLLLGNVPTSGDTITLIQAGSLSRTYTDVSSNLGIFFQYLCH